jgi:cytoskeleton protein RodZ
VLQAPKSTFAESRDMMSAVHSADPQAPSLSAAARVGADLRAARLRLGWSLTDIAAGLRIRLPYLEALEAGDVRALPGPAYAVGFLRTYGGALGLDADELSRRFRSEAVAVAPRTELTFPAPVPERGVPAGAVVLVGVVLAIGAYVGWYRLSGEGRLPAEVTPPIPARLAPLAEQAVPPPAPAAAVPVRPAAEAAAAANAAAGAVGTLAASHPATSVAPSSAAAMSMPTVATPFVAPPAPSMPVTAAPPTPPPATATDTQRIVIRAKADAWVQVREPGGHTLISRLLRAGESWPVPPNRPGLLLTLGNAGGTELLVDGVVAPGFGLSGAVRRDLPLDADQIKEGKLPGQQADAPAPIQPVSVHGQPAHGGPATPASGSHATPD